MISPLNLRGRILLPKLAPGAIGAREKKIMKSMNMTRRGLLGAAAAVGSPTILGSQAQAAAEFDFKLGTNTPETHPLSIRAVEVAKEIAARSSGQINITVFPNSQLGGAPEMLSQLRAGGIELLIAPSMTLSTLVPLS